MKIKFIRPHTIGVRKYKAGEVLDLPNDKAEKLKKLGVVAGLKAVKPSSGDSGSVGEGASLETNPEGSGKKKKRIY